MAASMLGQKLGRYLLLEELGRGGMATVYRAEDTTLGRAVAIKVLHTFLVDSGEIKQRFLREARAIAALRHPNIVEVFDFQVGDVDTPPHLVTELVRGPALSRFVAECGTPLPEVAALIVLKVADGLAVAHRAGIVHRDVKPENVLIDQDGRVVLSDFGIARMAGEGTMTKTGALVGSPAYMSPEQARSEEVDARSDVFSLGTTLYHLATGTLPFGGKNPLSMITAILGGRYESAVRKNPRVPGALEQIIDRCLRHLPAERYRDAGELGAALRALCADAGLTDADAELKAYFAAPGEYNAKLVPKLVAGALRVARDAVGKGQAARALRACDRVLSLEPGHV
ncbi:MAG TPA: serine/threonine-protein kinase, partial [Polyangia bacterium]|nr:serine/threonine-protein kinase [Polyangia bacterium]